MASSENNREGLWSERLRISLFSKNLGYKSPTGTPMSKSGKILQWPVILIVFTALFSSCTGNRVLLNVTNPAEIAVNDAPVVISRSALQDALQVLSERKVPGVFLSNGEPLPSQADDLDGDGRWDELFFLVDLDRAATKELKIKMVNPARLPEFASRSNIRFASITNDTVFSPLTTAVRLNQEEGQATGRFQFEGPGWENDRVGFRNYFDARNGMDIFGKTTAAMILDSVGINEDYHAMQPWGMDILRVGTSLGAGSLAIEKNGALHRLGPEAKGSIEVITDGPLRSILRLHYNDWIIEEESYQVTQEIIIYGGAWYYESKVTVAGNTAGIHLVTGITSIDLAERVATEKFMQGRVVSVSTFGNQAFLGERLGLAVMTYAGNYLGYQNLGPEAPGINNTFIVRMSVQDNVPVIFRFYAGWELSSTRFTTPAGFVQLLEEDAVRKANPVRVHFVR
ncbi:MAG TPA: DUF4861 family protein [Bacteroidales bacterium]|nr:DUF4861 family protein [Bacteroidales bacterium]